jgi:UDP-N-acetylglucosamine 2-epimerase
MIRMFNIFFKELHLPAPEYDLGIGAGSPSEQIGKVMVRFGAILDNEKPDYVVVDSRRVVFSAERCTGAGRQRERPSR